MKIEFMRQGIGPVKDATDYLLSRTNHKGDPRNMEPRLLKGDIDSLIEVCDSSPHKWKYASGGLMFQEEISEKEKQDVIESFESHVLAGMDPGAVEIVWIEHNDHGRTELNFVLARIDKNTSKSFNPFPPGHASFLDPWRDMINIENGYSRPDVVKNLVDMQKSGERVFDDPSGKKRSANEISKMLTEHVINEISEGRELNSRDDVVAILDELEGVEVQRGALRKDGTKKKDSTQFISVKIEGIERNIRLKGALYDTRNYDARGFALDDINEEKADTGKQREELAGCIEECRAYRERAAKYNQQRYGQDHSVNTRDLDSSQSNFERRLQTERAEAIEREQAAEERSVEIAESESLTEVEAYKAAEGGKTIKDINDIDFDQLSDRARYHIDLETQFLKTRTTIGEFKHEIKQKLSSVADYINTKSGERFSAIRAVSESLRNSVQEANDRDREAREAYRAARERELENELHSDIFDSANHDLFRALEELENELGEQAIAEKLSFEIWAKRSDEHSAKRLKELYRQHDDLERFALLTESATGFKTIEDFSSHRTETTVGSSTIFDYGHTATILNPSKKAIEAYAEIMKAKGSSRAVVTVENDPELAQKIAEQLKKQGVDAVTQEEKLAYDRQLDAELRRQREEENRQDSSLDLSP